MEKYQVTLARNETRIWTYTVTAENEDAAEKAFREQWGYGELANEEGRVVHAEEFIHDIEKEK